MKMATIEKNFDAWSEELSADSSKTLTVHTDNITVTAQMGSEKFTEATVEVF